jgi:SEC-C motif
MKLKRNDPCHCGSGKKYKHCHLTQDTKAEREQEAPLLPSALTPYTPSIPPNIVEEPQEIDPEVERLNQLYQQFQDADYLEKKAILRTALEEKALDGELAFEFFNDLYGQMVEQEEREEFAQLVSLLQQHQPEIYATENHWFWSWEITNALALRDDEALQRAVDQLIAHGDKDLDQFYPMFNCLLYHDRRQALLNALAKHRPRPVPGKYFPGVEGELNQKFADLLILNYIETHAQSDLLKESHFESLCSTLASYTTGLQRDGLTAFLAWAGGITSGQWSLADFQFVPPAQRQDWWDEDDDEQEEKVDPAVARLRDLSCEFLYYARHTENIALTKADLARRQLVTYILARHRGELVDEETRGGPRQKNRAQKGRVNAGAAQPHLLLPDHKTLDRYLIRFFGFLANGTYEGAALFELIPTWVRFLANPAESVQALRSLQALSQSMHQLMEKYDTDPALAENMGKWQKNALP